MSVPIQQSSFLMLSAAGGLVTHSAGSSGIFLVLSLKAPCPGKSLTLGKPGCSMRINKKYSVVVESMIYHFSEDLEELPTLEKDLLQGTEEKVGREAVAE